MFASNGLGLQEQCMSMHRHKERIKATFSCFIKVSVLCGVQVSISPFSLLNNGAANISTNLAGAAAAVRPVPSFRCEVVNPTTM